MLSADVREWLPREEFDNFNVSGMYDSLGLTYETYIYEDAGRLRCINWVLSKLGGGGDDDVEEPTTPGNTTAVNEGKGKHDGRNRRTCIDIGCASGRPTCEILASHGHDVIGLDISPVQIELARKHIPNATFELGDCRHYEPPVLAAGGHVDAVVSFYALAHLHYDDVVTTLRHAASWLQPGTGVLALGMLANVNGKVKFMGYDVRATALECHELVAILENQCGLTVVQSWEEKWRSASRPDTREKLNQFFLAVKPVQPVHPSASSPAATK